MKTILLPILFFALSGFGKEIVLTCTQPMSVYGEKTVGGDTEIELVYSDSIKQLIGISSSVSSVTFNTPESDKKKSELDQWATNNRVDHLNSEFKKIKTSVTYLPVVENFEEIAQVTVFAKGQLNMESDKVEHDVPEYAQVIFKDFTTSICREL